jgi:hypothetical protein
MQARVIDAKVVAKERKRILKSAASVGSGTARAISQILALSDQSNSWRKTTKGSSTSFTQQPIRP